MVRMAFKRRALGATAALLMTVGMLGALPATSAFAQTIKILKSADGKVVLICHYSDNGTLLYCDVTTPVK
jgi:hypothetical protein